MQLNDCIPMAYYAMRRKLHIAFYFSKLSTVQNLTTIKFTMLCISSMSKHNGTANKINNRRKYITLLSGTKL